MLFLLEFLRILVALLLAPILWLARWAGILLVILAVGVLVFGRAMDAQAVWVIALLVIGVGLITATNLLYGLEEAWASWIYFRQQFYVARKIPGKPIGRIFSRYLDDRVAEVPSGPDRIRPLD